MGDPFMDAMAQSLMDHSQQVLAESRARDVAFAQQLAANAVRRRTHAPNNAMGSGVNPNAKGTPFTPSELTPMPNANDQSVPVFPAEKMGARMRQGQSPMYPGYVPDSPGRMAQDFGMAPVYRDYGPGSPAVIEDERRAALHDLLDKALTKPGPHDFGPGVSEHDLGTYLDPSTHQDPNQRLLPNNVPSPTESDAKLQELNRNLFDQLLKVKEANKGKLPAGISSELVQST